MIRRVAFCALAVVSMAALVFAQPQERKFRFTYTFTVRNAEQGKRLRVWFPKAHSDRYQKVELVSATGDLPVKQTKEPEYGNEMFYGETPAADKPEYHFEAVYEVTRYERLAFQEINDGTAARLTQAQLKRYLQPDKLVPTTGKPAEIAA